MRRRVPKTATPKRPPGRGRRIAKRVGQVALALAFVGVCAGGWVYHRAQAQISEGLVELGEHMMAYAEARHQDAPRDLVINGQVLRFSSGTTPRSTAEVLDFYEARCAEVDGQLIEQMTALADAHPEAARELPRPPAIREDDGARGYVTCLDMGPDEVPIGELAARIRRYGETGDVSAIGDLRFVFAEQLPEASEHRTHFVAMWTTGSFDVDRMFPEEGDAPGADVPGLRRPDGARRVLTGFERGVPHRMTVYEARSDESRLVRFYRSALEEGGFALLEHPERIVDSASPRVLVAERGDRMVTVVFHERPDVGLASAAIFDAR